jgi:cyclic beta-1,2-glucan synthetase
MKPAATDTRQSRRAARALSGDARLRHSLATEPVLLTNGRYTVKLNELGSGYSEFDSAAVTRWSPDATCNAAGFHIYLRDKADQFLWSAAQCPTQVEPSEYRFYFDNTFAESARVDRDISSRLSVCVSPEHDYEIRLLKLLNLGGETRTIEVTSYLEWVLGSRDADASHPAFAKLFVETCFCLVPAAKCCAGEPPAASLRRACARRFPLDHSRAWRVRAADRVRNKSHAVHRPRPNPCPTAGAG